MPARRPIMREILMYGVPSFIAIALIGSSVVWIFVNPDKPFPVILATPIGIIVGFFFGRNTKKEIPIQELIKLAKRGARAVNARWCVMGLQAAADFVEISRLWVLASSILAPSSKQKRRAPLAAISRETGPDQMTGSFAAPTT